MLEKGAKIGDYTLLEMVGSGGFADVWKAEKRTALDVNWFALKFFRPKEDGVDFEKINKEIKVWKQLKGLPHIISVTELDQFEDYVYVVSDFAEDGSLTQRMKADDGKNCNVNEAIQITLEILTGLENLHEKGFVHRDLKPDNVVIMNGKYCLTDFGITREIRSQSAASCTAGTFEYMPPEAFDKNPSISTETDIWAAGVILQELLTGKLPYPQDNQPSLIAAILMSEPESLPESVPEELRLIVDKALKKDRKERFKSANEMRVVLVDAMNSVSQYSEVAVEELVEITDEHLEVETSESIFEYLSNPSNVRFSHERISGFDDADEDIQKALEIYQSLDSSTNLNLENAVKEMQAKGILEMKEYMMRITKQFEDIDSTAV